jgi:ABC-type multidrug transport system fused ATPase/permease subunit
MFPHGMTRLQQLQKQIARLQRRTEFLNQISRKYWNARRIIFIAGAVLALVFCNVSGTRTGWFVAGLLTILFFVVTILHNRVRESINRVSLLIDIKRLQIARIHLDWDQLPPVEHSSTAYAGHPFATDLDIVGQRSLHRLLDSAVTSEGSERLKSWLLEVRPNLPLIEHRQRLVRELKNHSLFRDKLQLLSAVARIHTAGPAQPRSRASHWNSRILVEWIERTTPPSSLFPAILVLLALSALNLVVITLSALDAITPFWPLTFLIYMGAMYLMQQRIASAWGELHELEKALTHFKAVFSYLESRSYKNTPGVAEICAPFADRDKRPSVEMRRLGRLAAALGVRTNPMLWFLVHLVVPWDFIFTHRLNLLRNELAHLLPRWLDAWYELEALNSLANFAYLNPHYTFPEISSEPNRFGAENLGHPLLNADAKVCNDFELDQERRIVILTGSNMAGKSTFLRTIGVSLSLAYAGSPVNARHFQTSLFRPFTCIKVSDSVQDGLSYFYAEVKRLTALLAAAKADDPLPVLFLIDEIFRGTNSRERLIGSRSYIHALSQSNTVGLVATHDLELIKLADQIDGVENFHFREEVNNGRMVFDYRLRSGPCPTTNALTIMRLEGLPVDV